MPVLRPDRVELALHTAAVFSAFCRATGVTRSRPSPRARSATPSNGPELLEEIERTTGLHARVISGEEEARYGWLAIANSTTIEDGFGLDIGGGSIQTLRIEGRRLADARSLRLGAVRVSERFLPDEKATAKQMKALRAHAAAELEELGWWSGGGRLVGIGGTIRNLAAAAMKRLDTPGHRRAGLPAHARRARGADRRARRAAGLEARPGEGHQVRPRAT